MTAPASAGGSVDRVRLDRSGLSGPVPRIETCMPGLICSFAARSTSAFLSRSLERRAHKVTELVVTNVGGILRPQPNRTRAGLEPRVATDEARVASLVPAVDRNAVLPRADEEAAAGALVSGHLVRQDDGHIGIRLEYQSVQPVEEGSMGCRDLVDIGTRCLVHGPLLHGCVHCLTGASIPSRRRRAR